MTDAQKKFQEAGEKLRADKVNREKEDQKEHELVKNQLAAIENNPQLADMYRSSATMGSENVAATELPLLKVHSGKGMNELADGNQPNVGWFFYKPTGEQFQTIKCHILAISRGFYAEGMDDRKVFNQILSGVIPNIDGSFKPFIMYMSGKKLSPMWDFGKSIAPYVKSPKFPIPMFALTVTLSTDKSMAADKKYGYSYLVKFDVEKNEDGTPVLVTDQKVFDNLRLGVTRAQQLMNGIIARKEVKAPGEPEVVEDMQTETIKPSDIPF